DESLAVRPTPQARRRDDLLIGPAADSRLPVRRDVARVHRAERAVETATASVDRPESLDRALFDTLGMTPAAARRAIDVLAARDLSRTRLRLSPRRNRGGQHEPGEERQQACQRAAAHAHGRGQNERDAPAVPGVTTLPGSDSPVGRTP